MTYPVVPRESISKDDADIFCAALEAVLHELSFPEIKKVLLFDEDGIVISFDKVWQPFLGHTRGHNNSSKPSRLAITSPSRVLGIARTWLKRFDRPQSAGRVFVNHERAVIHELVDRRRQCDSRTLGTWQWDAEDPLIRIRRFWDSVKNARIDEEVRAANHACVKARHEEMQGDPAAAESYWSLARRHLQRVDQEWLFETIRCGVDLSIQWAEQARVDQEVHARVDQEVRASELDCFLARLKEGQGDSGAAELYRSSARQHLQRVHREDQFDAHIQAAKDCVSELERRQRPNPVPLPNITVHYGVGA